MKKRSNGLKLIAVGLVLSHEDRKNKVNLLNEMIDSVSDAIRSSSDVDGMPHASNVGDTVGARVLRIERYENERDIEQERINAVEWAYQYIGDMFSDNEAPFVEEAVKLFIMNDRTTAQTLIREKTNVSRSAFFRAKDTFIKQILLYLRLQI